MTLHHPAITTQITNVFFRIFPGIHTSKYTYIYCIQLEMQTFTQGDKEAHATLFLQVSFCKYALHLRAVSPLSIALLYSEHRPDTLGIAQSITSDQVYVRTRIRPTVRGCFAEISLQRTGILWGSSPPCTRCFPCNLCM